MLRWWKSYTNSTRPGRSPNGMQATRDGIWILDQKTNQGSGNLLGRSNKRQSIRRRTVGVDYGYGVGAVLASTYNRQILRIDRQTGETLQRFDTPGADVTGPMALRSVTAACGWPCRRRRRYMRWIRSAASKWYTPIPAPGKGRTVSRGEGSDLWCVETSQRAIYRLNAANGAIREKIEIPEDDPEPHGMTMWDGAFLVLRRRFPGGVPGDGGIKQASPFRFL